MKNEYSTLETQSETQEIIDLASKINPVEIGSVDHIKRIALPPEWQLQQIDDEKLLLKPSRKKASVTLDDTASFCDYISRHKQQSTTIYCKANYSSGDVSFLSLINDHDGDKDGQDWRDFIAKYSPSKSEEWTRWVGSNKKIFSQIDFAEFIENNLQDIATSNGMPTGQQLLEMSISFEANQDMRFKSAIRLQNGGVDLNFTQDDNDQTLKKMKMFERISIGIPVFWNSSAYRIDARVRYRVKDAKLTFWYELIRFDKVFEDAIKTMIIEIKEKTGVHLYIGSAGI